MATKKEAEGSKKIDVDKAVSKLVTLAKRESGVQRAEAQTALGLNQYGWLKVTKAAKDSGKVRLDGHGAAAVYRAATPA